MGFETEQDTEENSLEVVLKTRLDNMTRFIVEIEGEEIGEVEQSLLTRDWFFHTPNDAIQAGNMKDAILELYKNSQTRESEPPSDPDFGMPF